MCLITDFRTAGRGKLKFGGQEGETDNSTALPESDPNYLGKASMEGNAVVRCEFGHVGDGRRADSSTRFPGASSSLAVLQKTANQFFCLSRNTDNGINCTKTKIKLTVMQCSIQ